MNPAPLGPETEASWQRCCDEMNQALAQCRARGNEEAVTLDAATVRKCFERFGAPTITTGSYPLLGWHLGSWNENLRPIVNRFWARPELTLDHYVRFIGLVSPIVSTKSSSDGDEWRVLEWTFPQFRDAHPGSDLVTLALALQAVGVDSVRLGRALLVSYWPPYWAMSSSALPFWQQHLEALDVAFAPLPKGFSERWQQQRARSRAQQILELFPQVPDRFREALWGVALGPKTERPFGQRCVQRDPEFLARLVQTLETGSAEARAAAADWLARRRETAAVPKLLEALKRERSDAVQSAYLVALESLGVPVEQFLDRAAEERDAPRWLRGGIPKELTWFPWDTLPVVHWRDSGAPVPSDLVKAWLLRHFKAKSPEPGALLRSSCACLVPAEREALGEFILDAWIGQDTAHISPEQAATEAAEMAQGSLTWQQHLQQMARTNPALAQSMGASATPLTYEEFYQRALAVTSIRPLGSAISSKGVLAVAGACLGASAAPRVQAYLQQWYGQRAAQCRALLQMLAWVPHPSAIQLLLAVGTRFRTRSIQKEAAQLAQALATRKGWTLSELADRTVSTAGFDDSGVLQLSYGPRTFVGRLNEKLQLILTDSDGKPLKALPDPRQSDDATLAAESRRAWSAAKKEVKGILTSQRERLYEALCTQQTWPFADWDLYLNRHPVRRWLAQRLIWAVRPESGPATLFRPLPDGSLTTATDDPVQPAANDRIVLAHESWVDAAESAAWREHFADYGVEPFLNQFGRPRIELPTERATDTEWRECEGHMVETFRLRGRATKLGYTRGPTGDGGWFYEYRKSFPGLGVAAVIEFTGNALPEENRLVALKKLTFERLAPQASGEWTPAELISLGEVPSVLFFECVHDLRALAADGSGYDPEWESRANH